MNLTKFFLILFLSTVNNLYSQSSIIKGKIIHSNLTVFPKVQILTERNTLLTVSDSEGNFVIENTKSLKILKFVGLRAEIEIVELNSNCEYIQLIMFDSTYETFLLLSDAKKAYRKEQRKKKKIIPKLMKQEVEKNIFDKDKMCYTQKL
ncbi:MAG TPA: hypothetical protein DCM02_04635 [Flavobacterium sp.]|nr:hypothetical protein [Flavobacterium sp.]HAT80514.1 hypothetical protein [Flavobacterium sp.]